MDIRKIDLNLLLVFETIYSTGNISHAAEQLDLSQPALSNALARLRKQLDNQLFVRSGNGVVPTSRAEAMIEPVRSALGTLRKTIEGEKNFDPARSRQTFRLILADPLERIIMRHLLADISPDSRLQFELQPPQSINIEDGIMADTTDLAVFLKPTQHPELVSQPLCPLDLKIIVRRDHPRIDEPAHVEQLSREQYVAMALAPGKLKNSEKVSIWQKSHHHQACTVNKVSSIAQIAAVSDLVGCVPALYAHEAAKIYGLKVIEPPAPLGNQYFHMIWHKRKENEPASIWLRQQIDKAVGIAQQSFKAA